MNILDKLKEIDQSKIQIQSIKDSINTALTFYDQKDELTSKEIEIYERLNNKAIDSIKDFEQKEIQKQKEEQQRVNQQKEDDEKKARGFELKSEAFFNENKDKVSYAYKQKIVGIYMLKNKYIKNGNEKHKEAAIQADEKLLNQMKQDIQQNMDKQQNKEAELKAKQQQEEIEKKELEEKKRAEQIEKEEQENKIKAEQERISNRPVLHKLFGWGK